MDSRNASSQLILRQDTSSSDWFTSGMHLEVTGVSMHDLKPPFGAAHRN
jgi:hypothetical protein